MHIVIVNAVYPPEPVVSAQLGSDVARQLIAEGHSVTVLCPFPSRPQSAKYGDEKRLEPAERMRGAWGESVIRLNSYTSPRSTVFGRAYESWSFGCHAARYISQMRTPADAVYANTWPLFSQWWLGLVCKKKQKPLVLHIQDLYPESLLRRLPRPVAGILGPLLYWFERRVVKMATGLIVISEAFRKRYVEVRTHSPGLIRKIPNWMDGSAFGVPLNRQDAEANYRLPSVGFRFLFFGNIGPAAGVELLIRAFAKANLPHSQLVIAGDGSMRSNCLAEAKKCGCQNIAFIRDSEIAAIPRIQSLADVCLLPLKKGQSQASVPSKLMTYMLSGKPVIATVDAGSEVASVLGEASAGWVGPPDDEAWLVETMKLAAATSPKELGRLGASARDYAGSAFSREVAVGQVTQFLSEVCAAY
jgi:glycosyltransferase involved in cell wall biosynthesis